MRWPGATVAVPTRSQEVVEHEADPDLDQAAGRVAVDGDEEGQRPHEMRGEATQRLALGERLPHQREIEQLEVAEAAVDELGGPRGRARGVVPLLEERDRDAAEREVAGDARAGHAAADHDDVGPGVLDRGEIPPAGVQARPLPSLGRHHRRAPVPAPGHEAGPRTCPPSLIGPPAEPFRARSAGRSPAAGARAPPGRRPRRQRAGDAARGATPWLAGGRRHRVSGAAA